MIGQRVRRREDPRFLRGEGRFVDDLSIPGALHVTFVRSPWAHARLHGVDASAASERPDTRVFTAMALDDANDFPAPSKHELVEPMRRPLLAREKVRFVGDIVAAVLAPTREASVDAAELVEVDYEPLPAVTDPMEAVQDEVLLFEPTGSNVCLREPAPDDPDLLASCEVISRGTVTSPRLAACPVEPRATIAQPGDDGRLTVWLSTQTAHQDRSTLATVLGCKREQLRVVAPDVGGGFGGKGCDVEDVLVAWLARFTGRPVRWTETRSEHMVAMHHGRAMKLDFEIGGTRAGEVRALRLTVLADVGAYPGIGVLLPSLTALMASGVYRIPQIETGITAVVTNTTPTGAVRGAGRPEATQMIERAIEVFGADCGLDPAEVRRRNFIAPDAFPYTTAAGATYDVGDYGGALERALEAAGYQELRAEQARRRDSGSASALGIGLSAYVEITNGVNESEFGAVHITPGGDAVLRTGSLSHGQGHETTFAQIASQRLGIPLERVTVVKGDTDVVPRGTGTYGSKSTQIGGAAAGQASEELVERALRLAAEQLEASPEDMRLDRERGAFHVAGSPQASLTWSQLAARMQAGERLGELSAEVDFQARQPTFPFGAHVAVVEVDTETGSVTLERLIAVDDAGTIINPLVAEGQVHGGVAAGVAQALWEELTYDEDGNPQNANLVTYCFPAAPELPSIERVEMQTPTPVNPLGAKGIGESGTIGATPAVINAVLDALAPFGVRCIEMPANGERVWRALRAAREDGG